MKNSQGVEFINHRYGQKYFKILKWWNLQTKLQAKILQNSEEVGFINHQYNRNIEHFSRGGIYKPKLQGGILQNSEETRVFPYKTHSQKYKPTENEPRKEWKNLRLYAGD